MSSWHLKSNDLIRGVFSSETLPGSGHFGGFGFLDSRIHITKLKDFMKIVRFVKSGNLKLPKWAESGNVAEEHTP